MLANLKPVCNCSRSGGGHYGRVSPPPKYDHSVISHSACLVTLVIYGLNIPVKNRDCWIAKRSRNQTYAVCKKYTSNEMTQFKRMEKKIGHANINPKKARGSILYQISGFQSKEFQKGDKGLLHKAKRVSSTTGHKNPKYFCT